MTITYSTTFVAICPVDHSYDVYELTVESPEMVKVEWILQAIKEATVSPRYQEVITREIAIRIPGARVTTVGIHSGVGTEVIA